VKVGDLISLGLAAQWETPEQRAARWVGIIADATGTGWYRIYWLRGGPNGFPELGMEGTLRNERCPAGVGSRFYQLTTS
jgi:hypothetical protein